jgi:hypothetical protein
MEDEPLPTLVQIFEILKHETRRWLYWRFDFGKTLTTLEPHKTTDPTGEMYEEAQLQEELEKRMKLEMEARYKKMEEQQKLIKTQYNIYRIYLILITQFLDEMPNSNILKILIKLTKVRKRRMNLHLFIINIIIQLQ